MKNDLIINAAALAVARAKSRYHLEYDEVIPFVADRIREFCRRENLRYKIAPDTNPSCFRIEIPNVTFSTIERLDAIYESTGAGH